ncbi:hypothetical protein ACI7RC_01185 [Brevibacillus sp. B_LB10_24]|uniref:hypothetical protein n=1 Tax=Brevibacillus sp. B_LB10_24 TaxID=3380645 RepID=UPI0038B86E4E
MEADVLDEYLDRRIVIRFAPSPASPGASQEEEGLLRDYGASGLLIERDDLTLAFVPFTAIQLVEIKPQPTWWQRLTGTTP